MSYSSCSDKMLEHFYTVSLILVFIKLEEWVTDSPFVISPRITFEVSVRLLGGLMALGYTIATILKRNSHVLSDDRVCVKLDWLEQLNRHYVQVQGRDRSILKDIGDQLGLEGSYIPRTYIEQIQLERLVNEVMALPEDLKTKLSLDEDLVSSPKEALSRASADRIAMRNKNMTRGLSQSYTNQRDKNAAKVNGYFTNNRRFGERSSDSSTTEVNQGAISQLSEHISALNDRMDEFTNRIEELNCKLTIKNNSPSQQNLSAQAEACNGSAPTSYFINSLGNGSITGSKMQHSSSSSQLNKDSPLTDEISGIARGQRQIMHQMDNLNNLLRGSLVEKSQQTRTNQKSINTDSNSNTASVIVVVAVGCLGIFLMKGFWTRK
ncbi:uridine-cytidine kinase C-like protein [Trifolium pratense]|uniref:Uridine-cytidine kinase C-like protein n=1 Tax=Trifolium pratense TaxID=57577 RepID=A0A2K3P671_TRIPR|nr:uridine-cytidine kinase C-like protein [Trifolium pratense]